MSMRKVYKIDWAKIRSSQKRELGMYYIHSCCFCVSKKLAKLCRNDRQFFLEKEKVFQQKFDSKVVEKKANEKKRL